MSSSKRILLVDDSPMIRATVSMALQASGYEVEVREAFDELIEKGIDGFDLILMDVQMPELFGDDVAFTLRGERGVTTPIYLFSSVDESELAGLTADAGVDGYIQKNISLIEIVARVNEIFAKLRA
ncbi:MAG TPA: response regulator [Kofleriaceae bacterium]|nr:response regulator [Kofleriaceae bacterium]